MKSTLITAALLTAIALPAGAQDLPFPIDDDPNKVHVSCYRGYFRTVAWDRPNSVFVEDLVQLGYTFPQADAIGAAICRDERGVRNKRYMRERFIDIYATYPPGYEGNLDFLRR